MSAYCRFKFSRQFFSKYSAGPNRVNADEAEDTASVTGQLLTKVCQQRDEMDTYRFKL